MSRICKQLESVSLSAHVHMHAYSRVCVAHTANLTAFRNELPLAAAGKGSRTTD